MTNFTYGTVLADVRLPLQPLVNGTPISPATLLGVDEEIVWIRNSSGRSARSPR